MWGFPADKENYKWVDEFLASAPLGKLFVRVNRASEKGDENSHYNESKTDDDRFDDPTDKTVMSYGADEAQFLANEAQYANERGPEAKPTEAKTKAFELVTRLTGRLEGVMWSQNVDWGDFVKYAEKIQGEITLAPKEQKESQEAEAVKYVLLEKAVKGKKEPNHPQEEAYFEVIPYKAQAIDHTSSESWKSAYFLNDEYAPAEQANIEEYLPLLATLQKRGTNATEKGDERKPLFKALLRRDYYPVCPRTLCEGQRCMPVGAIPQRQEGKDQKTNTGTQSPPVRETKFMLFYCPRCNDFYRPSNPILRRTPGSFFHATPKKASDTNGPDDDPYFFRTAKTLHKKGLVGKMETYQPKIFGIPMMPPPTSPTEEGKK